MCRSSVAVSTLTAVLLSVAVSPCQALANTGSGFLRHSSHSASDHFRARDESLHPKVQSFLRSLDGVPPPALIQTGLADLRAGNKSLEEPRVLYVLYSDSRFYETRLRWVAETWGSRLPNGTLVAIGDTAPPDSFPLPVHETQCPTHSHEEGACCKYGEAVIEAGRRMQQDPSLAWAYFMDDDVYARPQAITQFLNGEHLKFGANESAVIAPNGLARGTFNCGSDGCPLGLCGGGGYAADRRAVEAMLSNGPADFLRKQMENCNKCNRWADLAVSQSIIDNNITTDALPGAYGWRMHKSEFDKSLERGSPEPLLYHYIQNQQQMSFLHSLFEPERRQDESERQDAEERAGAKVISRVVARVISRVVSRLLGRSAVNSGCVSFHGVTTCHHGPAGLPPPVYAIPWVPEDAGRWKAVDTVAHNDSLPARSGPTGSPLQANTALAELLVRSPPSQAPAAP